MASLGMKTGFSYLKYPHLYFSLYICSFGFLGNHHARICKKGSSYIALYLWRFYFLFSNTQNVVFHQWNSFCMVNFQINRMNTLNIIKIS